MKLQNVQPCGDYKEFTSLVFQLMGEKMDNARAVCAPGAYHRARWMAKGIYCLKIFIVLFRDQFQMSKH